MRNSTHSVCRYICSGILILLFSTFIAEAGDPAVKFYRNVKFEYTVGDQESWTVEVDNPYNFAATKYRAAFLVVNKNDPSDTELFEIPEFDFQPMTKIDVSIAPRFWTAKTAGEYYVEYTSSSPDDIDTTNNTLRHDFSVSDKKLLDRTDVTALLRYQMSEVWKLNMDLAVGYVTQTPLDGSTITSKDDGEFSATVDTTVWFAWVDTDKYSEYTKDQYFVMVDRTDSTLQSFHTQWYPMVDGMEYPGIPGAHARDDIAVGDPPETENGSGTHISDPLPQDPPKKRACALIIAGGDESASAYRDRFVNGADFMKGNLTREKKGAQVHPDDVVVLTDPSPEEVTAALRGFRDKCETFYFVYTGHGGEYSMATRDSSYLWFSLFMDLDSVNAADYQVMISSCHAGKAIENFDELKWRYSDSDITIVASSAADTSSYSQAIVTGGGDTITVSRYLWAFAKCYGDAVADRNGDGVTSFEEAHRWVLRQNPQISWAGKGIVEVQRPQIRIHARTVPKIDPVALRHTDVEIHPREIADTTVTLTVEVDPLDMEIPKEDSIVYISSERIWNFEYETKARFRIDMQFTYDAEIDETPPLTGGDRLGIVRRDSTGEKWMRHYPTLWDPMRNRLTAIDVRGFSDWAIAVVKNSAPHASGVSLTTTRDVESAAVRPWVADRDTGDVHVFSIEGQPGNGTARVENNALRYLPHSNFVGDDSFTFRATDAGGASVVGTATVRVTGSNRPPVAADDKATTAEDSDTFIAVLDNDSDADGDLLRIVSISPPLHGNAAIIDDTLIHYSPAPDFHGSDTLTYSVADPASATATANVVIEVTPVNDAPGFFVRLLPLDGSSTASMSVPFTWRASQDVDGDDLAYILSITAGMQSNEFASSDTTLTVDLSVFNLGSGSHAITWTLRATDSVDTTYAANGTGDFTLDNATSTEQFAMPQGMALHPNYPNPFREATTVRFTLAEPGAVRLDLFSLSGERIRSIVHDHLNSGVYQHRFQLGEFPAGCYLLRLEQNGQQRTHIITLMP